MDAKLVDEIVNVLSGARRTRGSLAEQYVAGRHRRVYVPQEASVEYKNLAPKAVVNLTSLLVRSLLQDMSLTGYRHPEQGVREETYRAWVEAGMMSGKTHTAERHAFVHGSSYLALIPSPRARDWVTGAFSPAEVYVQYEDFVNDPRPTVFACKVPGEPDLAAVWIDRTVYLLDLTSRTMSAGATSEQFFADTEPVVRLVAGDWIIGTSGKMEPTGEVYPVINPQDRLNQAVMDLLLVQTFGAVVLRYVAGLDTSDKTEEEARAAKVLLAVDRLLTADDPETKFGTLAGTPLEPYIRNVAAAVSDFAVTGQIPPSRLMSKIENVGADAILITREPYEAKLANYRETFGERFEAFARALAVARRLPDPGADGYFTWRSTELRTIAEIADAAPKLHSVGLNIEPLLRRSLAWRQEEVDEMLEGYQEKRTEMSPDVAAIVDSVGRQTRALAPVPERASSGTGAPEPIT